jgi:hypothetical protein
MVLGYENATVLGYENAMVLGYENAAVRRPIGWAAHLLVRRASNLPSLPGFSGSGETKSPCEGCRT